jgi:hypothetical protein
MNASKDRITGGACISAVVVALLYGAIPEVKNWPRATVHPDVKVAVPLPAVSDHRLNGASRDPRLLSLSPGHQNRADTQVGDDVTR